jgi:hypothetical protein
VLTETGVSESLDGYPITAYVRYVAKEPNFQAWIYRDDELRPEGIKVGETGLHVSILDGEALEFSDTSDIREAAHQMLAAADEFDCQMIPGARIIRWSWVPAVTEVVIYHRVADGVDRGEIIIPMRDEEDSFAHELAALKPGETRESDFKLDVGFPKEHHSDTLVGVFMLKTRLSDDCAIVVPVAQTEVH